MKTKHKVPARFVHLKLRTYKAEGRFAIKLKWIGKEIKIRILPMGSGFQFELSHYFKRAGHDSHHVPRRHGHGDFDATLVAAYTAIYQPYEEMLSRGQRPNSKCLIPVEQKEWTEFNEVAASEGA